MSGIIAAAGITAAAGLAGGLLSSGSGGGTQTQESATRIDDGTLGQYRDNWDLAVQAANQLRDPYGGNRVAGMTPEQQNLINQLYTNANSGWAADTYNRSMGATNALMGFQSGQVTPQTMAGANLDPYLFKGTKAIIDPAMELYNQQEARGLGQIGDAATRLKAFGGSRQGVESGVYRSQSDLQKAGFVANLNKENFYNAQQQARGDISQDYTAQMDNLRARQFDANLGLNAANQYARLGDQGQANWLSGITSAMGGQSMVSQTAQDKLNADMALYNENRQQPLDVLSIRQNALSQQPTSTYQNRTSPGPTTNPLLTGLGTASTVAGMFGAYSKYLPNMFGSSAPRMGIDQEIANWSNYGVPGATTYPG